MNKLIMGLMMLVSTITYAKQGACRTNDLIGSLVFNVPIDSNCIYWVSPSAEVLQVVNKGILVHLEVGGKSVLFFVKTNRSYVDGESVGNLNVYSKGTYRYLDISGAIRTVHSFVEER